MPKQRKPVFQTHILIGESSAHCLWERQHGQADGKAPVFSNETSIHTGRSQSKCERQPKTGELPKGVTRGQTLSTGAAIPKVPGVILARAPEARTAGADSLDKRQKKGSCEPGACEVDSAPWQVPQGHLSEMVRRPNSVTPCAQRRTFFFSTFYKLRYD